MKINYARVAALPLPVRAFCYSNDGWVVGSGAAYLLDLKEDLPRDWDVLVPLSEWPRACKSIPAGSETNSHGGVKVVIEEYPPRLIMDVWGDDLARFLVQIPASMLPAYAVHPRTMTFLQVEQKVKR